MGRTDIQVETTSLRLVVEVKRGRQVPLRRQGPQVADRFNDGDEREGRIVVIAEYAEHFPPVVALPTVIDGIPITYLPCAGRSSRGADRELRREPG